MLETVPNQTLTSTTTNTPFVTSTIQISDNSSSTVNPNTIDNNATENVTTSTTTPYNLLSSASLNDEDLTTTTLTSSITIPTTTTTAIANDYLTTIHTDELVDEVTKNTENQFNLSTETTRTESTSQNNLNNIQNSKAYSRRIPLQQTTNIPVTTAIPSNQILGTVSSPRPFGFPKRRLTSTTLTPITEDPLRANKVEEIANVVKTVTDVNSNAPKVSSNTNVLSSTMWGAVKREHIHTSTQKYVIRTSSQMHFVESSLTTPSPRSFNIVDNDHENTVTQRSYSWRDVRRPIKPAKANIKSSHEENNNRDFKLKSLTENEILLLNEVAPVVVENSTVKPLQSSKSTVLKKVTSRRNLPTNNTTQKLEGNSSTEKSPFLETENPPRKRLEIRVNTNKILDESVAKEESQKNRFNRKPTERIVTETDNEYSFKENIFVKNNQINSRKARQNRGSVKYSHSDLSSLLSVDYAPKSQPRKAAVNRNNSNTRKFIQKNNSTQIVDTVTEPPKRTRPSQTTKKIPIRNSERANINESDATQVHIQRRLNIKDSPVIFVEPTIDPTKETLLEKVLDEKETLSEVKPVVNNTSNEPLLHHRRLQPYSHASINMKGNVTKVNPTQSDSRETNTIQSSEKLQFNKTLRVGKALNSQNSKIFTIDSRNIQLSARQLNGIPFATTPILKLRVLKEEKISRTNEKKRYRSLENSAQEINDLMDSSFAEDSMITAVTIPLNRENKETTKDLIETTTLAIDTEYSVKSESIDEKTKDSIEMETEIQTESTPSLDQTTILTEEKFDNIEDFTTEEIFTTPLLEEKIDSFENSTKEDAYARLLKQRQYENQRRRAYTTERSVDEKKIESTSYKPKASRRPIYRRPFIRQHEEKTSESLENTDVNSKTERIQKPLYRRPFVARRESEKEEDILETTEKSDELASSTIQSVIDRIRRPIYRRPYSLKKTQDSENENEEDSITVKNNIQRVRKPIYSRIYGPNNLEKDNEDSKIDEEIQETTTTQSVTKRFLKPIYKRPFTARTSSETQNLETGDIVSTTTIKSDTEGIRNQIYKRPYGFRKPTLDLSFENSENDNQLEDDPNVTTETQESNTIASKIENVEKDNEDLAIEETSSYDETQENSTIPSNEREEKVEDLTEKNETEESGTLNELEEDSTKQAENNEIEESTTIQSEVVSSQQNKSIVDTESTTIQSEIEETDTTEKLEEVSQDQTKTQEVTTKQSEIKRFGRPSSTKNSSESANVEKEDDNLEKLESVSSSTIKSEPQRIRKLVYRRPYGSKKSTSAESLVKESEVPKQLENKETTTVKSIRKPLFKRPSVQETINSEKESEGKDAVVSSSTTSSIRKSFTRRTYKPRKSAEVENVTEEGIKETSQKDDNQQLPNFRRQYLNLNRNNIKSDAVENEAEEKINKPSLRRTFTKRPTLKNDVEEENNAKEVITRAPYTLLRRISTTTVRATSKTLDDDEIRANKLQQRKNLFLKRTSINEENLPESEEYDDYDEYVEDEYEDENEELVEEQDEVDSSRNSAGVGSKPFILNNVTNNETQADNYESEKNVVKAEDNVYSKRRLQKYQLSPVRSQEESNIDNNQVNRIVSDDARDEDDEHSTTIENNTTAIPRRKIVLKYRRPLAQLNANNINNLDNFNSTAVSDTNYNNTATNDSIENTTQLNNIVTTKRVRKIIRKIIKPLNQTNTNASENNRTLATRFSLARNRNLKELSEQENELETTTTTTTTPTSTTLRRKLIARRLFTTTSTTKASTVKYTRRTTVAPLEAEEDDEEYDEEYDEEEPEQIVIKSTTTIPKPRPLFNLQKNNILKSTSTTTTTTEAAVEAEEDDYEEEQPNEEENNVQIPVTPYRNTLNKSARPAFLPKTNTNRFASNRSTERPRVFNRPQVVTNKPGSFKPTNTRSFERKFSLSTTEASAALLEDLDIEALNARNKKIFDSKKHISFKNKLQTQQLNNSVPEQEQEQNTENINEIEYTTLIPIIHDSTSTTTTTTTTISNEISIVNKTNDNEFSSQADDVGNTTPQTPSTTLLHIFTLFDEMSTTAKPATTNKEPRLLSEQPKHKVVEINRIVEITSKEDKLRRKSKKHPDVLEPIGTSSLKVVSLPHLEQLGEISVVKYVHLVDGSDIEIDGHSTVADYTPTEPNIARNSAPVRNSLPYAYPHYVQAYATERSQEYEVLTQRDGKALIPEVIREAVETSTIPLEGLFDHMRQAKQLNGFDVTELPESVTDVESTSTTVKPTTKFPKYVRPLVPLLRPESNESAPIVISLSNLDQVILSKVDTPTAFVKTDKNTQNKNSTT